MIEVVEVAAEVATQDEEDAGPMTDMLLISPVSFVPNLKHVCHQVYVSRDVNLSFLFEVLSASEVWGKRCKVFL